jgi:hypothetical protein
MRTLSCVVGALTLVIGAFIVPVIGAEDHVMVTPNELTLILDSRVLCDQ